MRPPQPSASPWLIGVAMAGGQGAAGQKPLMAEDVFKNVQVLKGIPVNEFMGTMGIFSAALGMSCEDCDTASDRSWEVYAADTNPRKRTARRMVLMMAEINRAKLRWPASCDVRMNVPIDAAKFAPAAPSR